MCVCLTCFCRHLCVRRSNGKSPRRSARPTASLTLKSSNPKSRLPWRTASANMCPGTPLTAPQRSAGPICLFCLNFSRLPLLFHDLLSSFFQSLARLRCSYRLSAVTMVTTGLPACLDRTRQRWGDRSRVNVRLGVSSVCRQIRVTFAPLLAAAAAPPSFHLPRGHISSPSEHFQKFLTSSC